MNDRPRVVFDCNVLLQAALSPEGPAAACLRLADERRITYYLSRATLAELRAVLGYPTIRRRNTQLTDANVRAFLDQLLFKGVLVRRVPHVFDYPRAPQDEPYVDLCVAARADYLVSRDDDWLSLMTAHSLIAKRFRQRTHPLQVLKPHQLIAAVNA